MENVKKFKKKFFFVSKFKKFYFKMALGYWEVIWVYFENLY